MAESSDPVEAPPADETAEPDENRSVIELLVQLGHEVSVLAFCEAQLTASRNMPEVRRAARDVAAAFVAGIAFLTAFVFANVAGMLALTTVLPAWLAALVLTLAWLGIGAAVSVALLVRAGHVTGWKWWRVFTAGPEESLKDLEGARADAEQAVLATLERLAPAITVEIAAAAMPVAAGAVTGVVDVGGDLIEASDDMVEAIAEDLPGGGVVNQMWDVVLMPGRFGVRVATTVLKRGEPE
ncbi:MAG TPA: phage holin family protein [Polyangia bacterium]|nr:phage holin family protein [Polyangia bacterium]